MRTLLVSGTKEFRITVPDEAKLTFGPFSPPSGKENTYRTPEGGRGTLRIYANSSPNASIIGVFAGVDSFRDIALEYSEKVATEEGASIWKSDQNGYEREDKKSVKSEWVDPLLTTPQLAPVVKTTTRTARKSVK